MGNVRPRVYEHVSTKDYKILLGDPFNYTDALDAFRQLILSAKFRLENSGSCSILNRTSWGLTEIRMGYKVVGPAGL